MIKNQNYLQKISSKIWHEILFLHIKLTINYNVHLVT